MYTRTYVRRRVYAVCSLSHRQRASLPMIGQKQKKTLPPCIEDSIIFFQPGLEPFAGSETDPSVYRVPTKHTVSVVYTATAQMKKFFTSGAWIIVCLGLKEACRQEKGEHNAVTPSLTIGYIDEAKVIKATQKSERQPYDVVRQALKEIELEWFKLEDYVDLIPKLRTFPPRAKLHDNKPSPWCRWRPKRRNTFTPVQEQCVGRIQVQDSSANVTQTINEDERTECTRHINAVLASDPDILTLCTV